jgi:RNA recognition motif-containing protein
MDAIRLYVGNIPFNATEQDLRTFFGDGDKTHISKVTIVTDRETGRSRGFAFVDVATKEEADKAIESLHQSDMNGRSIVVNMAQPRIPRDNNGPRGHFGGGYNNGGGYGGGGYNNGGGGYGGGYNNGGGYNGGGYNNGPRGGGYGGGYNNGPRNGGGGYNNGYNNGNNGNDRGNRGNRNPDFFNRDNRGNRRGGNDYED